MSITNYNTTNVLHYRSTKINFKIYLENLIYSKVKLYRKSPNKMKITLETKHINLKRTTVPKNSTVFFNKILNLYIL